MLAALLVALPVASPAFVKRRADVPEAAYLALAARAEYAAGRVKILDARGSYSGVLVGDRWVLTARHPLVGLTRSKPDAPVTIRLEVDGRAAVADHAWLFPAEMARTWGGVDIGLLRLTARVATPPMAVWTRPVARGTAFTGIGQGIAGIGTEIAENGPRGAFTGYRNTVDHLDAGDLGLLRADFDDGSERANTLARLVAGRNEISAQGSSATPLDLEGSVTGGDSGSGVWIDGEPGIVGASGIVGESEGAKGPAVIGIASMRRGSAYGGQSGYVALGHPRIAGWLRGIAARERAAIVFRP